MGSACSWLPRSLSGLVEGVDVAGGRPVEAGQGPGQRPPVVLVQRVPETQGGGEEDELRHREVRVLEGALGAPPMAKYVSHGSRAGATARPHFGVDKFILRRPDEHCLRASDPVHEPAPPRSLSHRPRPPVDTLPGRNGRLVLTSRSLPSGCQVNCTFRTALVSVNGEGARCVAVASHVRLSRPPRPTASGLPSPGAGRFGSSHADKSTARRVTASVVRRRGHQRDAHGLRRRHHPRWPEQSPRAPVTRGVSWVVVLALRARTSA